MNERIEQLFGQALDQAVPETWTTLNPAQLARLKDKFAELIVKECMYVGRLSQINNGLVDSDIKDHFYGVEE